MNPLTSLPAELRAGLVEILADALLEDLRQHPGALVPREVAASRAVSVGELPVRPASQVYLGTGEPRESDGNPR